jgi:hypothetical protein
MSGTGWDEVKGYKTYVRTTGVAWGRSIVKTIVKKMKRKIKIKDLVRVGWGCGWG